MLSMISYHLDINMDNVVAAVTSLFLVVTGVKPKFKAHGGSNAENLALQNIQVGRRTSPTRLCSHRGFRQGCAWYYHICSRNSYHGYEGDMVDFLYWAVQTWTKGESLLPFSTVSDRSHV